MTVRRKRRSLVEERTSTPDGTQAFHAAKLGLRVVAMLNRARDAADLRNADLAAVLDVSEGRVSQVLGGDGNLHVGTVGRFLAACGYELELVATPIGGADLPTLAKASRARRRDAGRAKTWDVFEQTFLNEEGVTAHISAVPRSQDATAPCAVPVGLPKLLGTAMQQSSGHARVMVSYSYGGFGLDMNSWGERIDEVVAVEEQELVSNER